MLPLIIGVSVDYGVYMVHRWIGEGKSKLAVKVTVESTGRAVALCALTTMIGFGAVATATWRGLAGRSTCLAQKLGDGETCSEQALDAGAKSALLLPAGFRVLLGALEQIGRDLHPVSRGSRFLRRVPKNRGSLP